MQVSDLGIGRQRSLLNSRAGSLWAETVTFDITEARNQYPLRPRRRGDGKYYEVHYELLVKLQGRNLNVSVAYPPGGPIQGSVDVSVVACFQPGTN